MIAATKLNDQIEVSFRLIDIKEEGRVFAHDFVRLLESAVKETAGIPFGE